MKKTMHSVFLIIIALLLLSGCSAPKRGNYGPASNINSIEGEVISRARSEFVLRGKLMRPVRIILKLKTSEGIKRITLWSDDSQVKFVKGDSVAIKYYDDGMIKEVR